MMELKLFNRVYIMMSRAFTPTISIRTYSKQKVEASTVNPKDVEHFRQLSAEWWNVNKNTLHVLNPLRVRFVTDGLLVTKRLDPKTMDLENPLKGVSILDVGCGGGIYAEALAKLGGDVTGVDAGDEIIAVAKNHALLDPVVSAKTNYIVDTIDNFSEQNANKFDVVVVSEVIEHVLEKPLFVESCVRAMKPGGSLFLTTFNKTLMSYWMAIICAEYLFKFIPKGTHDWSNFISPENTSILLSKCGCKIISTEGLMFNFIKKKWYWQQNQHISYGMHAVKKVN